MRCPIPELHKESRTTILAIIGAPEILVPGACLLKADARECRLSREKSSGGHWPAVKELDLSYPKMGI